MSKFDGHTQKVDMSAYEDVPSTRLTQEDGTVLLFFRRKDDPTKLLPVLEKNLEALDLTSYLSYMAASGNLSK